MPTNTERRNQLADAGLRLLDTVGTRGLTFRAVDAEAGVPEGTASNYYANRDAMFTDLTERVFERLAPEPRFLETQAMKPPSIDASVEYIQDIYRRLSRHHDLYRAFLALRLEGSRRPELGRRIATRLRQNFEANAAFNQSAGLPGGSLEVALVMYAIDGLFIDQFVPGQTSDIDDPLQIVDILVRRLMGGGAGQP